MVFDRNAVGVVGHLGAVGAAGAALSWAARRPDSLVLFALVAALLIGVVVSLIRFLQRRDRELARFVAAIGHADLSQRFGPGPVGAALDAAMARLRGDRRAAGEEARFQAALIEESPVALLTVGDDRTVRLLNKAARTLFGARDGRPLGDFADAGAELLAMLDPARGRLGRALVAFAHGAEAQRAVVTATVVARAGGALRLVAVEPIGRELDAAEIAAQADLVRVLTHEIMNVMTPITSLARSAATLIARVPDGDPATAPEIADARRAIGVVADRADGLLRFVGSYRRYATLPLVEPRRFVVADWAQGVVDLFAQSEAARDVAIAVRTAPPGLTLVADADLLAQALLNLLKNAAEAGARRIELTAVGRGDEVEVTVTDDGAGIADAVAADMFLPFFTSKPTGTGIGLSLARQVAVAHRGTIAARPGAAGGAALCLRLPAD